MHFQSKFFQPRRKTLANCKVIFFFFVPLACFPLLWETFNCGWGCKGTLPFFFILIVKIIQPTVFFQQKMQNRRKRERVCVFILASVRIASVFVVAQITKVVQNRNREVEWIRTLGVFARVVANYIVRGIVLIPDFPRNVVESELFRREMRNQIALIDNSEGHRNDGPVVLGEFDIADSGAPKKPHIHSRGVHNSYFFGWIRKKKSKRNEQWATVKRTRWSSPVSIVSVAQSTARAAPREWPV